MTKERFEYDWEVSCHLGIPESVMRMRAEGMSTDLIVDETVREVFEWAMNYYHEHGQPASPEVLGDEFDFYDYDKPITVIEDLLRRLRVRYAHRVGLRSVKDMADVYDQDPMELPRALIERGHTLSRILSERGEAYTEEDYDSVMAEYHKRAQAPQGPSLGLGEADEHFSGQRGLTFMLGAPKSYKSWFTVRAILTNILDGHKVAAFSLEMPAHEMAQRLYCMKADLPWWKFLKGGIVPADQKKLRKAEEEIRDSGQFEMIKPAKNERGADAMIGRAQDIGAEVVFIDQLQYVETASGRSIGSKNETGDYWEVLERLRDYSDEFPIWVVHQFNRSVMNAPELPAMQQIKGSSAIEETATLALGLWANKAMRINSLVALGTLASRNYEWKTWEYRVSLSDGCDFIFHREVEDEDED